jgi:hypothetical protein
MRQWMSKQWLIYKKKKGLLDLDSESYNTVVTKHNKLDWCWCILLPGIWWPKTFWNLLVKSFPKCHWTSDKTYGNTLNQVSLICLTLLMLNFEIRHSLIKFHFSSNLSPVNFSFYCFFEYNYKHLYLIMLVVIGEKYPNGPGSSNFGRFGSDKYSWSSDAGIEFYIPFAQTVVIALLLILV